LIASLALAAAATRLEAAMARRARLCTYSCGAEGRGGVRW
jgi:hypothetical protein